MEWEKIELLIKMQYYILGMRPVFRPSALFSDETENYVTPAQPEVGETVTIRFRTKRDNVDAVYLCHGEESQLMELDYNDKNFDYYKAEVPLGIRQLRYWFQRKAGRLTCYYDKCGLSNEVRPDCCFCVTPGFHVPEWAKGAVMYQIFVDRFYNGDLSNDVEDREYFYIGDTTVKVKDWNKCPAFMGIREFYGGDIQGVWDKLDYLQDLGVDVIYFNPIFVSPSNHKYDIQDYDYIDPHYGKIVKDGGEVLAPGDQDNSHATKYIRRVTDKENLEASNRFFAEFVEEVHRRGMKIILDGVFNHCGSFNKWLDRERIYENEPGYEKGAYVSADSPYRNFFKFNNQDAWPYNPNYDGWWGHDTLPKLAYENSKELHDYILGVAKKWVSPPYNVDGWRLDVAADLGFSNEYNHQFWKEFRDVVKEANPEALILAEHYGDPKSWLQGDQWDTVMNYDAFMEPLTWFFTGMEKHSDQYREDMLGNGLHFQWAMGHYMNSFQAPSLEVAMNELSNHDHSRFLTRTNHRVGRVAQLGYDAASQDVNKAVLRSAVVMQFTWPGAPTIYYGDEAGVCGFTDPDNRRTYPWGHEDHELINFHKKMIRIHKVCPAIMKGSVKILWADYNYLAYGRFTEEDQVLVVFNAGKDTIERTVRVRDIGIGAGDNLIQLLMTDGDGYHTDAVVYQMNQYDVTVKLPPTSAIVLHAQQSGEDELLRKNGNIGQISEIHTSWTDSI